MSKQRVLIISVWALILLNIGVVLFFTLNKPPHPGMHGGPRPMDVISDKLEFDSSQKAAFEKLVEEHNSIIHAYDDSIRIAKDGMMSLLKSNTKGLPSNYQEKIAQYQAKIEQAHYNHFVKIKNLCHENQLASFDELIDELPRMFGPKPPHP